MTSPALHRPKESFQAHPPAGWMGRVVLGTLSGGIAASSAAFFLQKKELALGLLLGGVLSVLNLYGLHVLTTKVLSTGNKNQTVFWLWNLLRWLVFIALCWFLLRISPYCLLGAAGTYLWFLVVLGWVGWRSASTGKNSSTPSSG